MYSERNLFYYQNNCLFPFFLERYFLDNSFIRKQIIIAHIKLQFKCHFKKSIKSENIYKYYMKI